MEATLETNHSEASEGEVAPPWLRWVFPDPTRPPCRLEHGLTLGRSDACDVVLDGAGLSRVHASIVREGPVFTIRDEDSRNGTFVDAERAPCAALGPGRVVRIGGWVSVVESFSPRDLELCGEIASDLAAGPALARSIEPARRVADTDLPIVVEGETGTGKEVVARAIHRWSGRTGPFQAVNCAALPEQLAEGELFGYRRGAFTGADRASPGHFRAAHGGTLLLDELNELPLSTQAKLLRALQEHEVTPLGESAPTRVDVRVIAAAQAPLARAVELGTLRGDLYMRLRGLSVPLPPLRQRRGDVPLLLSRFVAKHAKRDVEVEPRLVERLCLHDWPGNVRELELVVRQLLAIHRDEPVLKQRFLPETIFGPSEPQPRPAPGRGERGTSRADHDRARLARALDESAGNVSAACASLNMSRQRAYRLLDGMAVEELIGRYAAHRRH